MGKTGEIHDLQTTILYNIAKQAGIPLHLQSNLKRSRAKQEADKKGKWWYSTVWRTDNGTSWATGLTVYKGYEARIVLTLSESKMLTCQTRFESHVTVIGVSIADPKSIPQIVAFIKERVHA